MTTSGYSRFSLDIAEIMEEAYERIGRDMRSGYDGFTARRSLNLLFQEMTNKGVNLWQIELSTLPLFSGTATYQLDDDTSDIMPDAVIRRSGRDRVIERCSRDEYLALPDKTRSGQPTWYLHERKREAPEITFWPVPDQDDTFVYWRIRYMEDVDDSSQSPDMPRRFLPAITSGLAYHLGCKNPEVDLSSRQALRERYVDDLRVAMEEDHERGSTFIVPSFRRR